MQTPLEIERRPWWAPTALASSPERLGAWGLFRRFGGRAWLLLCLAWATGCHRSAELSHGTPIPLSVRLGWQVNANSAGQVAALEEGFYGQEGLEVTLEPGGLDLPSVNTVASGQDAIGFANSPDLVINARAAGAPLKIIAVIQQRGYHAFLVRADSPIQSPKDWEGRRVGVKYASPTYLLYQVLLKKLGVDRSAIHEVPLKYSLNPFTEGEIDVYPGALSNEAISLEMMGIRLRVIDPADYGIETCGNVVFTTEKMIREQPEVLRKFVKATLRGWAWCLRPENQDRTVTHLQKHVGLLDAVKERRSLETNVALVVPDGLDRSRLGHIDTNRLDRVIENLREFGVLTKPLSATELCDLRFVP